MGFGTAAAINRSYGGNRVGMSAPGMMWSIRAPGSAKLRHFDSILRGLREAGFSVDTACRGFHAITTHIHGFTLQKLDFPVAQHDLADVAKNFLAEMSTADFPSEIRPLDNDS